jgi:hypothetical protein
VSHLSITKASLTSALTFVVGQLVAFVPAFGPDKQALISAGTAVIAAVFLIANAIHKLADSNVDPKQIEAHAVEVAKTELAKVDLNSLAASAVNGNLPDVPALVKSEVGKLLSEMFNQPVLATTPEAVAAPPAPIYPNAPADL